VVDSSTECSACQRADERHDCIFEVGNALAGYRQEEMREPRAEVTGRIDRISRSTTQGETDRCNEETDDERVQPFGEFIRPDEEEAHHQDERTDDLTGEVGNIVRV